jgi:hypothetical protein
MRRQPLEAFPQCSKVVFVSFTVDGIDFVGDQSNGFVAQNQATASGRVDG